ncbi:MAG: HD domain-containing protein [Candidatus Altiarchaeota archaeon]|nr:HD domain-containing protein [Candidatus Altiarchaeota archaeon]
MTKTIRDPIYGDIELGELELKVLDASEMQRLRRIRQLSFCSLVYPGANQTRFEHSIGTMYLSGKIARRLGFDEELTQSIRLAGLLHDVGHLPFSHSLERVFGMDHEKNARTVLNGQMGDILEDGGFKRREIYDLICGKGYGKIVSSQIDADRMDYLVRDSHYTGVAYGAIDTDRIISVMGIEKERLFFQKKGIVALEALLIARNQMFEAVYLHHTVRVAEAMLEEAMRPLDGITSEELLWMGDEDLKMRAKQDNKVSKGLLDMLDRRRLYKICCSWAGKSYKKGTREKVIHELGIKPHQLLIYETILPKKLTFEILVKEGERLDTISKISSIAKDLEGNIRRLEETEACAPPEFKDKARMLFERV